MYKRDVMRLLSDLRSLRRLLGGFIALLMLMACAGTGGEGSASNNPDTTERVFDSEKNLVTFSDDYFIDRLIASDEDMDDAQDAEYNNSHGAKQIGAHHLHARNIDGSGQTIAVVDTPINTQHRDLVGSFVNGYDASNYQTNRFSGNCSLTNCGSSHGTHVAGIISANRDGNGMLGVAYNANIKPVAIFNDDGRSDITRDQLTLAITQAAGNDIVAMNNSWGSTSYSRMDHRGQTYFYARPPGEDSIDTAGNNIRYRLTLSENQAWRNAVVQGTIVVFANGNHGMNSETGRVPFYNNASVSGTPATTVNAGDVFGDNANIPSFRGAYPIIDNKLSGRWLTVVSVDYNNKINSFSNGCGIAKDFCLAAPGDYVNSTSSSGDGYEYGTGTSMAAPHVSGSIALLKQAFPSLSSEEIVSLLLVTATDLGEEGTDEVYGHGMVNLEEAVRPQGVLRVVGYDNSPLVTGDLLQQSTITLSNHFGVGKSQLQTGTRDDYNRTFVATPTQLTRANIAFDLDDYMDNLNQINFIEELAIDAQTSLSFNNDTNQENTQQWLALNHRSISNNHSFTMVHHQTYRKDDLEYIGIVGQYTETETQAKQTPITPRFSYIRPTGKDVTQFATHHQIGQQILLKPYAVAGTFDTGNRFEELGADLNIYSRNHRNSIEFGLGRLHENQQFLGATSTGAYAIKDESHSIFTDVTITQQFFGGKNYASQYQNDGTKIINNGAHLETRPSPALFLHVNYADYRTNVPMAHTNFVEIDNLTANRYQIGITGKHLLQKDDRLDINLATKLGIRTGTMSQNSVMGYRSDGSFYNVTQDYSLATTHRHRQLNITYQGTLTADKTGRFFTTITRDHNYQHQPGLNQTGLVAGFNKAF